MSFITKTDTFIDWLKNHDVDISEKVEIQDFRNVGQGRALVAKEEISPDEDLFKLPPSVFLNAANNSLIEDYPELKDKLLDLSQWEALILVLIYEWQVKKDVSKWKLYLDVLPINDPENYKFDQLIFWSDEELEHLKASFITKRVGKDSAEALLLKVKGIIASYGITALENISHEDLHKAAALIMSYSFDVQRSDVLEDDEDEEADESTIRTSPYIKSMLPLADTLNANTNLHNASLMKQESSLVMRSIKAIAKGEQIYNTYFDHPNAEILRRYGYVEVEGSVGDFGEISLDSIKQFFASSTSLLSSNVEDIISILIEVQEEEDEEFVVDSYDCYISGEAVFELTFLVQLLTVLAGVNDKMSFNDIPLESKGRGIRRVFRKCYQLVESGKLTESLKTNLIQILEQRISEYPSLEEKLEITHPMSREVMAKVVLQSELRSLRQGVQGEELFKTGETKYSFVPDQKLLNNILKKDIFADVSSKKQKTE